MTYTLLDIMSSTQCNRINPVEKFNITLSNGMILYMYTLTMSLRLCMQVVCNVLVWSILRKGAFVWYA